MIANLESKTGRSLADWIATVKKSRLSKHGEVVKMPRRAVGGFGSDVEIAPKKAYVSLRRSKQFGLVQPSTKTRVDIGLVLRDTEPAGRLEASGSFNAMVTHRVRVEDKASVDDELIAWLRKAYDAA
jgi:hypothetical protein